MPDCPLQGANTGTWGTDYYNFLKQSLTMSGANGGQLAIVCNENHVVCNEDRVVVNIELDV